MSEKQTTGLSIHEIKLFEEPIAVEPPPEKKKRGRKSSGKYVSFTEARAFIRGELIQSRTKYFEWWARNKPSDIPRFPYRIYAKEWVSWNDFLGNNNNSFGHHNVAKWRPYDEAMMFVHLLEIESYTKWLEYCKSGNLPSDIPSRPDLVYTTRWRTWNHWLGNRATEAIDAKREAEGRTQVYFIVHETGTPENVLTFGIEPSGVSGFKARWERDNFNIIRIFWYDRNEAEYINKVVNHFSSVYLGEDRQRIVPNFWEIVYYLEQRLEKIDINKAFQTSASLRNGEIHLL